MRTTSRDWEHLLRLVVVVAVCVGAFLLLRQSVIPQAFGQFGHYRPGALEDNQDRQTVFAGQAECFTCHEGEAKTRSQGRHRAISCEACHGPQAKHAADPSQGPSKLAAPSALCVNCHEKDAAKPSWLPQVTIKDHYGDTCNSCHQPHQPKM